MSDIDDVEAQPQLAEESGEAEAADGAEADPAPEEELPTTGPGSRVVRGARNALAQAKKTLGVKTQVTARLEAKEQSGKALSARDRDTLTKAIAKRNEILDKIPALEFDLEQAIMNAKALAAAAEAAEKKKAEEAELTRAMSDLGGKKLVEIVVITCARKFDNNSDTADSIWEKHVAPR